LQLRAYTVRSRCWFWASTLFKAQPSQRPKSDPISLQRLPVSCLGYEHSVILNPVRFVAFATNIPGVALLESIASGSGSSPPQRRLAFHHLRTEPNRNQPAELTFRTTNSLAFSTAPIKTVDVVSSDILSRNEKSVTMQD
jgi:hypothetical protein